jgi:hypothetical protein
MSHNRTLKYHLIAKWYVCTVTDVGGWRLMGVVLYQGM